MRRLAQVLVLVCLAIVATPVEGVSDEAFCRDICIYSMGYCTGEGGLWQMDCNNTAAYYDAENDICDLDAYCHYWAGEVY